MCRDLYYFNPDHEMAIADGHESYTLPGPIVRMANDLAWLPAYYAGESDAVMCSELPDAGFLNRLEEVFGLTARALTPEMVTGKWNAFRPWGWNPRAIGVFRRLKASWDPGFLEQLPVWNDSRKALYSRLYAAVFLQRLGGLLEVPPAILPVVCRSFREAEQVLQTGGRWMVKAPWSSSGRGILPVAGDRVTPAEIAWMEGVIRRQGAVTVEKLLDKVVDFALEFQVEDTGCRYLGISLFETGKGGEYGGNHLGSEQVLAAAVIRYTGESLFLRVREQVGSLLAEMLPGDYRGTVGVDMMVYRDTQGVFRIQPCVEINLRYNMGILSLALYKRLLFPESKGVFRLSFSARPGELLRLAEQYRQSHPLSLREGRIASGYLALTPVTTETTCLAWLLAGDE